MVKEILKSMSRCEFDDLAPISIFGIGTELNIPFDVRMNTYFDYYMYKEKVWRAILQLRAEKI
jgi:hypothetical protein